MCAVDKINTMPKSLNKAILNCETPVLTQTATYSLFNIRLDRRKRPSSEPRDGSFVGHIQSRLPRGFRDNPATRRLAVDQNAVAIEDYKPQSAFRR
ncbi:hypothetical protein AA23498_0004 [Acetobacter nitrogenifigens DSM 23921 = NBRC 105050]|uniref:Uncharacterized protein n=1 Tax=Acetobacter nitrogenifigens DSM 23921 = NBRC 105050 TaxID=1120919 RepID=A0A511X958_9PROT|nr:hypothetical protein AA23498_0004 [Acetobacter nitrogenifigens DSM 23921 = NBRC 105050]GEN59483.1 hypothetical protein ANI02nite_13670 [Acetobacter nitrogenifigens DSM 23921 = NBRC 105050]